MRIAFKQKNAYFMAGCGQLVKTGLYFGADGLRGEKQGLLVATRVQDLIDHVPCVDWLFEIVEPFLGRAPLLLVLRAVEGGRGLNDHLFDWFQFHYVFCFFKKILTYKLFFAA
jgi:hypothetical protein